MPATTEKPAHALPALALLLLAAALLLLPGIPQDARDRVYAATHRDLRTGNRSRPIDTVIVLGNAGSEADNRLRAKLCGGSLWIDHLAEALGADLVSHAHAYAVRSQVISARGRTERVISPIADGSVQPIHAQAHAVARAAQAAPPHATLYVLVADPTAGANSTGAQVAALAAAANDLILHAGARRFLAIDAPTAARDGAARAGVSMALAERLINDPRVEVAAYDSASFLRRMQRDFYKYGLRYPDHACVHGRYRPCARPDRFFWCDHAHVGSKAHFFMADDIVQSHLMASLGAL
ncbi:hypothetical protein H4R18_004698 [Coemansia javaensis]|uniref:SGNH domain-containing protein n=1 Tax=Coemansia javaensis TaxID=2761396 RepID=A0A9W8H3L4_9FUNG|nr:hypothetical protein H4R18_004698 [Coemansia javaensis]